MWQYMWQIYIIHQQMYFLENNKYNLKYYIIIFLLKKKKHLSRLKVCSKSLSWRQEFKVEMSMTEEDAHVNSLILS
jgi:hypothetical protein